MRTPSGSLKKRVSVGLWPGARSTVSSRPPAEIRLPSSIDLADLGAADEAAEPPEHRCHRRRCRRVDAVAEHRGVHVAVLDIHRRVVVAQEAGELRHARDRRPGRVGQRGGQADVVLVLVREDDQLDVLGSRRLLP